MEALLQTFRELGPAKLAAIGAVVVAFIIGFIFLSLRISSPPLAPLYNNLDLKESGQIVNELEAKRIPYEIRGNGTQICLVQHKQLIETIKEKSCIFIYHPSRNYTVKSKLVS